MSPKDRDLYVDKHTPRAGVPQFVEEECTGKYEGEELAIRRAKRSTHERLSKLEAKADKAAEADATTAVSLARVETKVDMVLGFIQGDRENTHKTDRVRISTRGKVIISVVTAVCGVAAAVLAKVLA